MHMDSPLPESQEAEAGGQHKRQQGAAAEELCKEEEVPRYTRRHACLVRRQEPRVHLPPQQPNDSTSHETLCTPATTRYSVQCQEPCVHLPPNELNGTRFHESHCVPKA